MKALLVIIGESFRTGIQGTRVRGLEISYEGQIKACSSHMNFLNNLKEKNNIDTDIIFQTYNTKYNEDLIKIYEKNLINYKFHEDVIGLTNLFQNSIESVKNINIYDYILYIRIDLFLKDFFTEIFNPNYKTITFPSICFKRFNADRIGNDPRVNDTMLFIPKKYYNYIKIININHNSWRDLVRKSDLTYDDLDTMLRTFHDSDSYKDYNPIYYIVNRKESNVFHSKRYFFDKNDYGKKNIKI